MEKGEVATVENGEKDGEECGGRGRLSGRADKRYLVTFTFSKQMFVARKMRTYDWILC